MTESADAYREIPVLREQLAALPTPFDSDIDLRDLSRVSGLG